MENSKPVESPHHMSDDAPWRHRLLSRNTVLETEPRRAIVSLQRKQLTASRQRPATRSQPSSASRRSRWKPLTEWRSLPARLAGCSFCSIASLVRLCVRLCVGPPQSDSGCPVEGKAVDTGAPALRGKQHARPAVALFRAQAILHAR